MAKIKKNPNDTLLKNVAALKGEVAWKNYEHKKAFQYLCKLQPNVDKEKLEIIKIANEQQMTIPCVYIMVIDGFIFKIGVASGTKNTGGFAGRVGSYNCGVVANRIRGTASTTNYWVLQSLLKMNCQAKIYALYCNAHISKIFGESFTEVLPIGYLHQKELKLSLLNNFKTAMAKSPSVIRKISC